MTSARRRRGEHAGCAHPGRAPGARSGVRHRRLRALPDGRHTRSLVITMSAKDLKTGWYGRALGVTRWYESLTKTGSDLHGRARNGTQRHR